MFQPAPHLVGLASTANMLFTDRTVRCWRYNGSVGTSAHSIGAASASSLICSLGSGVVASAEMIPSICGLE